MIKNALILMIISLVSAGVLAVIFSVTQPVSKRLAQKEEQQALKELLPQAIEFKEKEYSNGNYFEGFDAAGNSTGWALRLKANGYSGDINMLAGVSQDAKITGVKIISQTETPGLGARIIEIRRGEKEPWFSSQFKGLSTDQLNLTNIDSITAATITSRAVVEALRTQVGEFLEEQKR